MYNGVYFFIYKFITQISPLNLEATIG